MAATFHHEATGRWVPLQISEEAAPDGGLPIFHVRELSWPNFFSAERRESAQPEPLLKKD